MMLTQEINKLKKKIIARGWDYKEGSWIVDKKERDLIYLTLTNCHLLK